MTNHFEKPKDWNVAPQSSWVSGTPIGQDNIRMPSLGDPGSHENASGRVSFGDDDPQAQISRIGPGGEIVPPGSKCRAGTKSEDGVCVPNPESSAYLTGAMKRNREREKPKGEKPAPSSFDRELPRAPETNPQIPRIVKGGYMARQAR
jgi:hypothetical protein